MNGPRWFKPALYAGLALGLVGTLYTAYRSGYDLPETVGLVAINISLIFVIYGLVLTALAALVNLIRGRTHLPKLSPREKQMLTANLLLMSGSFAAVGFALWHPFGWFWSMTIAVPLYVIGLFAGIKLARRFSEEEMTRFQDRVLAAKEESNPLYFIP